MSGLGGTDTAVKTTYVRVNYEPVIANFTADTTAGPAPLMVHFTDQSAGVVDTWLWSFGDGMTDTVPHPTHVYTATGVYTVALTVSGPGGSDTLTRTNYISVYAPVVADFTAAPRAGQPPLTVVFTDTSSGDVDTWLWDFGDGYGSAAQHPSHIYASVGSYTVTLTASGPGGSDIEVKANHIAVTYEPVVAAFTADRTSGPVPLTVHFADQSSGPVTSWQWVFGDGGMSTLRNPVYTYWASGARGYLSAAVGHGHGGGAGPAAGRLVALILGQNWVLKVGMASWEGGMTAAKRAWGIASGIAKPSPDNSAEGRLDDRPQTLLQMAGDGLLRRQGGSRPPGRYEAVRCASSLPPRMWPFSLNEVWASTW